MLLTKDPSELELEAFLPPKQHDYGQMTV